MFDLLDPQFYAGDQHAAYTWMRANEPVYRDVASGLWAVTRNVDVRDVESRRTELALLFEQLTQRLTNLRVVTEPVTEPNIFVCAVESFDLGFDVR